MRSAVPSLLQIGALFVVAGASCERPGPPPAPDAGSDAGPGEEEDAGPPRLPDEEPPVVTFVGPEGDCLFGDVTFRFDVKDAGAGVGFVGATFGGRSLTLETVAEGSFAAAFDAESLPSGLQTLVVTAVDRENNLVEASRVYGTVREGEYFEEGDVACGEPPPPPPEDLSPPVVEILVPSAALPAFAANELSVSARVTDDLGPVTAVATLAGASAPLTGATATRSGVLEVSGVMEGAHELVVTATDGAGRSTSATRTVTIDHTPPSVTIVEPLPNAERAAFTDVVCEASDASGVSLVRLYEVGNPEPLGATTSPSAEGSYGLIYQLPCAGLPRQTTFEMRATDPAGNAGSAFVDVTVNIIGCDDGP